MRRGEEPVARLTRVGIEVVTPGPVPLGVASRLLDLAEQHGATAGRATVRVQADDVLVRAEARRRGYQGPLRGVLEGPGASDAAGDGGSGTRHRRRGRPAGPGDALGWSR